MFSKKNTGRINTVIGADMQIKGSIRGTGSIRIDGYVEGDIESKGEIVIGEKGRVTGSVHGATVSVAGNVEGDVVTTGHLHLLHKGSVIGNVSVGTIVIEQGGQLHGYCHMLKEGKENKQDEKSQEKILQGNN